VTRSGSCDDDYGLDEIVLVPLPAELQGTVIRPSSLTDLEPHEEATAKRLAAVGFNVYFNEVSRVVGAKNPDVTIDGQIWEMKSPQGAGKNTVAHQFARAAKQETDHLIIDGARSALPDDELLNQMRRRLSGGKKFTEAMHVAKDATVRRMTRSDKL
jgi:hypothetical protein